MTQVEQREDQTTLILKCNNHLLLPYFRSGMGVKSQSQHPGCS